MFICFMLMTTKGSPAILESRVHSHMQSSSKSSHDVVMSGCGCSVNVCWRSQELHSTGATMEIQYLAFAGQEIAWRLASCNHGSEKPLNYSGEPLFGGCSISTGSPAVGQSWDFPAQHSCIDVLGPSAFHRKSGQTT